ncbi:MAG TPA: 1-(5-phosphoribosyl)-5-[(5-phosphoribosylamino)methylideneamino]imidazole-4-carboxamide isomerase [Longimicrobium sp.]|nr:1-(5-phosphoribosyl)-5-[(5-phosphoribosylamino)methylideneamino]imidazole-4-carboxamide isomerase [Longimicrobium sp.]
MWSDECPPPDEFAVYPAIDLRGGRCVRLEKGDAARETVYGDDPVAVARSFADAGAAWIHVVDLDAAFGTGSNRAQLSRIAEATGLDVQTGGGLRTVKDLEEVFEAGAYRAVIGTAAIENPAFVRHAVKFWGAAHIAVGLDARGRRPAVRGWTEESAVDLFELGKRMVDLGVRTFIHTDIERDGMLQGPNLELSLALAQATGAQVIVSGGVSGQADVEAAARAGVWIGGIIVGKAIYEGRIDLAAAIRSQRGVW